MNKTLAATAVGALMFGSSALAAPSASADVVLGKGIAGVNIGMSKRQVLTVLPRPQSKKVDRRKGLEVWYWKNASVAAVEFSNKKVLSINTTSLAQRTSNGIGVGSRLRDVIDDLPAATCTRSVCRVGTKKKGKVNTLFYLRDRIVVNVSVAKLVKN